MSNYYTRTIPQCQGSQQPGWYHQSHQSENYGNQCDQFDTDRNSCITQNFDGGVNGYPEYQTYASEGSSISSNASTPEMFAFDSSKNFSQARHPFHLSRSIYDNQPQWDGSEIATTFEPANEKVEVITSGFIFSNDEDEYYDEDDSQSSLGGVRMTSPEDEERRRRRRERNKVAATKCRHKKKEHVIQLNIESQTLESNNFNLKTELQQLEQERNHLITLLTNHRQYCIKHVQ